MELEITYIPVDKITPYERNARKHTPFDVDKIKASITIRRSPSKNRPIRTGI